MEHDRKNGAAFCTLCVAFILWCCETRLRLKQTHTREAPRNVQRNHAPCFFSPCSIIFLPTHISKKENCCRTTFAQQLVRENRVHCFIRKNHSSILFVKTRTPAKKSNISPSATPSSRIFYKSAADRRIKDNVARWKNIVSIFVIQRMSRPCCATV